MEQVSKRGGLRAGAGRRPGVPSRVVRLPAPIATVAHRIGQRDLRWGEISGFIDLHIGTRKTVPLVGANAACGFPSPADDFLDRALDFNELLIENPAATFAVRIAGDSMTGAGIFPNDIAVVDRSKAPADASVVLALLDGEFTIKRYRKRGKRVWLQPENPAYKDIPISEETDFEIWGVVKHTIRVL